MPGTVTLHRVIRAPAERIYRAFITPSAMVKWLPPHGFTGEVHSMDARVGGGYRMSFTNFGTGGSHSFGGTYLELVPGEKLRYNDQFDNPDLYFHRQKGVFVFATKYPGNAANAGLQRNDIILRVDGTDVTTLADVEGVHKRTVESVAQKSRIVFTVLRAGLTRQIVLDFARDYSKE